MYKFAASDTIFDGVSNIYLISIATAFLAVIVAFYCSNFLKDESEKQLKRELEEADASVLEEDIEEYLPNDSSTESELENNCSLKQSPMTEEEYEDDYYGNSDEEKDNCMIWDAHLRTNTKSQKLAYNDEDDDGHVPSVDGLVGKIKTNRVKELEAQLTRDQLEDERRIEREQLAAIFELLKKQEAELNMKEIDENEFTAQLSLYR